MIPDEATFIAAKPVVLDNHKGGMIIFDHVVQRLDIVIPMRNLLFVTLRENKMIFVQCVVAAGTERELRLHYDRIEPLFKMIANSFVIQEQYQ